MIGYEKYILKKSSKILDLIKEELKSGVPLAIGIHPIHGLFLIETCGQGPVIIFEDKK